MGNYMGVFLHVSKIKIKIKNQSIKINQETPEL